MDNVQPECDVSEVQHVAEREVEAERDGEGEREVQAQRHVEDEREVQAEREIEVEKEVQAQGEVQPVIQTPGENNKKRRRLIKNDESGWFWVCLYC